MTTLEDLFLDAIEDARNTRTWPAAIDLHEHTKTLVSEFGKRQGLYSADERLALMKLRNETLTKVRSAVYRTTIDRDVAAAAEDRERHVAERAERLDTLDHELAEAERELEALDRGTSRSIPGHPFEGLTGTAIFRGRGSRGYERER
ncbi:hypothetical protein [Nocardia sp. NPDC024068]|uniref:hypothetical protein n=1 Tax=Nocardia sp. NPDC024068 TaxID=3157197 RepID=UPI0033E6710D